MPEQIRDSVSDRIEPAFAPPAPETPAPADEGGRCRPLSEFLYSAENDASSNAAPILAIRVDSQHLSGRQIKPLRTPCERIDYPFYDDDDEEAAADLPEEIAEEQEPLIQEPAPPEPVVQDPIIQEPVAQDPVVRAAPKEEQPSKKPSEPVPGAPFPLEDPAGDDVPILYRRFLDLRQRRAHAQSPSPPSQTPSFENLEQVQELMSILPSQTREALRDFLHSLRVE